MKKERIRLMHSCRRCFTLDMVKPQHDRWFCSCQIQWLTSHCCLQEYTVKPDIYNFSILLAPLKGNAEEAGNAAAELWLQGKTS